MIKFLPLINTLFFLSSFLTANGQNPTVTINQSAAQTDPTNNSPIMFTVVFDQPVIGFTTGDVVITGTASAGVAHVVTGGPTTYYVTVAGMISCGTIIANIPAGVCTNTLTQPNLASTSIDNTVTYLNINPNVTINQAASQPDPTNQSPINFTVQFDQLVTGFATGDVTLTGTAGATTAIVTGSGNYYNVAVSGMTASGTVIATIAAGVSQNACTQPNNASTSTDNTVTITCVPPVVNVTPATSCGGIAGGAGPCNPLTASGNADIYIWSPLAGLFTSCTMTVPYAGTNLSTVYAGPTTNTIYTVTGTILATGCTNTATALVYYRPPAPVVTPSSVNMCLGAAAVKLYVSAGGIPARPAVWSPIAGLFFDATTTIPYNGSERDTVWVRPTPAGVYTYQVTTQAIPPSNCTSPPRSVVVTVGQPTMITQQPTNQNICMGASAVFSVTAAGAAPLGYQWQVSTNGGATYNNLVNLPPNGGVNTNTLTISTPSIAMSGYLYRVAVSGGPGCANALSSAAMLTVNPLPTIVIIANPLIIGPTQTTTIFSTVTPNPAATYTWYYNNSVLPGAVSPSLLVNYGSPGDYQLKVTDINGCTSLSNIITIANSFTLNMLSYPNPSGGIFQVIYLHDPNNATNNTLLRSMTVYNNWGAEIITRVFPQTTNYQKIDVDVRQHGKGLYWVELKDANGKRLGMNRVVVQ